MFCLQNLFFLEIHGRESGSGAWGKGKFKYFEFVYCSPVTAAAAIMKNESWGKTAVVGLKMEEDGLINIIVFSDQNYLIYQDIQRIFFQFTVPCEKYFW